MTVTRRPERMRRSRILFALAAVVLTACGGGPLPIGAAPEPASLTCDGGVAFPANVLDGPGGAENGVDPAAQALRAHVATDHVEIDWLPDAGWIEAARSGDVVLYIAPDPAAAGSWMSVSVARGEDGAWAVDGWGGCALQPVVGAGLGIASFRVAPEFELDPDVTEIPVLVTERACNSGEDARGRVVVSGIDEDDDSVTVTFAVRPRPGGQNCPSNPETPFLLELPAPLGERSLLDGSSVPPRDATDCPDIAICS
jgi:hypothetical protein